MENGVLIALDWGTTNVRAALLAADGLVIDKRQADSGVGHFSTQQFAAHFRKLTQGWPALPAIASGMVGSRQGWREASYLPCPASLADLAGSLLRFHDNDQELAIVPGLKIETDQHRDVMRGEETQIAGLLADESNFSGTVVLPGSHSKWVRVHDGVVRNFRTYMTGELFDACSNHTILRHSVEPDDHDAAASEPNGEEDHRDFVAAVGEVFQAPGSSFGRLFGLRADTVLSKADKHSARERLSGLLIGMELEAAARDGFDVQDITIIGTSDLTGRYSRAATVLAAQVKTHVSSQLVWPALFALARTGALLEGADA